MRDNIDDGRGSGRPGTRDRAPVDMLGALDMLGRRIGGALVLGGALIGIGLYWGGDSGDQAQTYQAFAADGEVFRVNTDSGTIIACNSTRCTKILERGQELEDGQGNTLFRVPPSPSAPAAQLPAPAPQQAGPAQPSPQPEQSAPKQIDEGD
jgi:hypothetical protein